MSFVLRIEQMDHQAARVMPSLASTRTAWPILFDMAEDEAGCLRLPVNIIAIFLRACDGHQCFV